MQTAELQHIILTMFRMCEAKVTKRMSEQTTVHVQHTENSCGGDKEAFLFLTSDHNRSWVCVPWTRPDKEPRG